MKTLIASTLIALAASLPATAQVGSGAAAAIAHFNGDYDSQDQRVSLPDADVSATTVSTRSGGFDAVYGHFNADHDSQDDVRGQEGATIYGGDPANGAGIFAGIAAAQAEDE